MFHHEDSETEMLVKCVKHIIHCFLELNVDEGITAQEAIAISVDTASVA
jgi:hypothetical protein